MIRLLVLLMSALIIIADAAIVAFFVLRWERRINEQAVGDTRAASG